VTRQDVWEARLETDNEVAGFVASLRKLEDVVARQIRWNRDVLDLLPFIVRNCINDVEKGLSDYREGEDGVHFRRVISSVLRMIDRGLGMVSDRLEQALAEWTSAEASWARRVLDDLRERVGGIGEAFKEVSGRAHQLCIHLTKTSAIGV
jgi:hypothetical protein